VHAIYTTVITTHYTILLLQVWGRFDPKATCFIQASQLRDFLHDLEAPWGFGKSSVVSEKTLLRKIKSLNLHVFSGNRVHFKDLLMALSAAVHRQEAARAGGSIELPPFVQNKMAKRWHKSSGLRHSDYLMNPVSMEELTFSHLLAAEYIQMAFRKFMAAKQRAVSSRVLLVKQASTVLGDTASASRAATDAAIASGATGSGSASDSHNSTRRRSSVGGTAAAPTLSLEMAQQMLDESMQLRNSSRSLVRMNTKLTKRRSSVSGVTDSAGNSYDAYAAIDDDTTTDRRGSARYSDRHSSVDSQRRHSLQLGNGSGVPLTLVTVFPTSQQQQQQQHQRFSDDMQLQSLNNSMHDSDCSDAHATLRESTAATVEVAGNGTAADVTLEQQQQQQYACDDMYRDEVEQQYEPAQQHDNSQQEQQLQQQRSSSDSNDKHSECELLVDTSDAAATNAHTRSASDDSIDTSLTTAAAAAAVSTQHVTTAAAVSSSTAVQPAAATDAETDAATDASADTASVDTSATDVCSTALLPAATTATDTTDTPSTVVSKTAASPARLPPMSSPPQSPLSSGNVTKVQPSRPPEGARRIVAPAAPAHHSSTMSHRVPKRPTTSSSKAKTAVNGSSSSSSSQQRVQHAEHAAAAAQSPEQALSAPAAVAAAAVVAAPVAVAAVRPTARQQQRPTAAVAGAAAHTNSSNGSGSRTTAAAISKDKRSRSPPR
jgi:Voltage-dependent L-type calcium channel, IQ-associated